MCAHETGCVYVNTSTPPPRGRAYEGVENAYRRSQARVEPATMLSANRLKNDFLRNAKAMISFPTPKLHNVELSLTFKWQYFFMKGELSFTVIAMLMLIK